MQDLLSLPWYEAYKALTSLLKEFHNREKEKSSSQLLKLLYNQDNKQFAEYFPNIKVSEENVLGGITPIELFASFNDIDLNHPEKTDRFYFISNALIGYFKSEDNIHTFKIFTSIEKLLKDYSEIKYYSWEGYYSDYLLESYNTFEQEQVWKCLDVLENKRELIRYFNRTVKRWRNIDLYAFSTFLYWLDSDSFFPLSTLTVNLLHQTELGKNITSSFAEYCKYCRKKENDIYRNLVLKSFNTLADGEKSLLDFIYNEDSKLETNPDFKLIGLQIYEHPEQFYKALQPDTLYKFYDFFEFSDDNDKIIYNPERDFDLYSLQTNTKISLSAILGKNGSGKSTIFEIISMIIYSLSLEFDKLNQYQDIVRGDTIPGNFIEELRTVTNKIDRKKGNKLLDKNYKEEVKSLNDLIQRLETYNVTEVNNKKLDYLNADLYIKTTSFFRIAIRNGSIKIEKFEKANDNEYHLSDNEVDLNESFLLDFFYTISINYSIYGLNRKDVGDWIFPLFHKNDAYQTPIVIEPYRRDGNIDINTQTFLAKSRMLAIILEKENLKLKERSFFNSFRRIAEEKDSNGDMIYKDVTKLKLSLNQKKFDKPIKIGSSTISITILDRNIQFISDFLGINVDTIEDGVRRYILHKLYTIADRYSEYNKYLKKDQTGLKYLKSYLSTIENDTSHITFKIRQAFYFLKYNLKTVYKEGDHHIDDLSSQILHVINENPDDKLRTIDLIPPSFFDVEIILNENIRFNSLSSGEKQLIYSVNSVLYHIRNIESTISNYNSTLIKYRFVNIILDEVELYFHPELQRKYISHLLAGIKRTKLNNIAGINIMCITHSPYMLSDIPESNILFLNTNGEIIHDKPKTFGANIHDILRNGFFMTNSIGELATNKIKNTINFIKKKESNVKSNSEAQQIISLIGEPIIRNKIQSLLDAKRSNEDDLEFYKEKVKVLESQL